MIVIPKPQQKLAKQLNTLQILRGGWYSIWSVSLFLLLASIFGINNQRSAVEIIGKEAVPSVLTAQQLRDSFADLDASLANELLLKPGANRQVLADFEKNRKKIAERLVVAAKNITEPAEESLIQSLQLNGSGYFLKLQSARDAHNRNDRVMALNLYRSAANLMEKDILPQAEQLDLLNSQEIENIADRQHLTNGGLILIITLLGLVQIGILVGMQIFLYQRMRRILNLRLIAATVVSLIFIVYTVNALFGSTKDLKIAKDDAFKSIHTLRQARALSYMANADESRYLLDAANANLHDRAFKDKIGKILTLPPNQSMADLINLLTTDLAVGERRGVSGLYVNQLNHSKLDGELAAKIELFKTFDTYLKIDEQIRQLYRSGKVAEAIALCTGYQQGQSNWAFERYRNANEKLRNIHETVFSNKIENADQRLNYFNIIAPVSLGGVAILTLFGLRPRLNEYL
jgi:hypothetical protein